jgi:hypothetical protein
MATSRAVTCCVPTTPIDRPVEPLASALASITVTETPRSTKWSALDKPSAPPADDYDMQRAHSLDGSIETDHFSVGTVTRLTAQFGILHLTCCSGSSPARPEAINWIGGSTTGLGR